MHHGYTINNNNNKPHLPTRQPLLTSSASHRNMNITGGHRNVSATSKVALVIFLAMALYLLVAGYTFSLVDWKSSASDSSNARTERGEEAVVDLPAHEKIETHDDTFNDVVHDPAPDGDEKDTTTTTTTTTIIDSDHSNRHPAAVTPIQQEQSLLPWNTDQEFVDHRKAVEAIDTTQLRRKITAYMEPPLQDTIPGTGDRGNTKDDKDFGTPPQFKKRLPLRTHTPDDLRKIEYSSVQTCRDMPGKFPIDRGLQWDETGQFVVAWNVGDKPTPPDFPEQEAPYCPVELDPFLPWIHDVFPSQDGKNIVFIAQNKRRVSVISVRENENLCSELFF
jgi:hypothetical protein